MDREQDSLAKLDFASAQDGDGEGDGDVLWISFLYLNPLSFLCFLRTTCFSIHPFGPTFSSATIISDINSFPNSNNVGRILLGKVSLLSGKAGEQLALSLSMVLAADYITVCCGFLGHCNCSLGIRRLFANTPQVFPVISGLTWLGMLLGLLIHWTSTGRPHYPSMASDQTIAYISDVGAESLKPLFIAGSCVTTIFLDLAFVSDVFLRNRGRLAGLTGSGRIVSWLSLLFAAVGTAGLILLSIFDTLHHHKLHDVFLLLFIAGYVISAVFICWEYQRLGMRESSQYQILRTPSLIPI